MIRPHIHVNVAMTADGKIDTTARRGAAISSQQDRERVDLLRAESDAVLVGGRTLIDEDPKLMVKSATLRKLRVERGLPEFPAKVGIVSEAAINVSGAFVTTGAARRLIYTTQRTTPAQIATLQAAGVEVFVMGESRVDLRVALESLSILGMQRVMVEGGATLIAEFFRQSLVDDLTIYIAPLIFAGESAPTLAGGAGFLSVDAPRLTLVSVQRFDSEGGILIHYRVG
jgi:2,5-diamino-6-(ribosylamino)-4(3H)-pyrimidinone 5'-phosphate reductase